MKPGQAFQPIRDRGHRLEISPGLFESLELLGREETLRRSVARRRSGLGGPSGSSARWKVSHARLRYDAVGAAASDVALCCFLRAASSPPRAFQF